MIRQVRYEDLKDIKIETYGVDIIDRGIYYALIIDGNIISFLNVTENKYYYKFHCNYTIPEYRHKGYFTQLLQEIIKKYRDKKLKADCLDSSYKIYLKLGFRLIREKQFNRFKIHYVEKLNEERGKR